MTKEVKCTECGSTNVESKVWYNHKTKAIDYVSDESDDCWCNECQAHNELDYGV